MNRVLNAIKMIDYAYKIRATIASVIISCWQVAIVEGRVIIG